MVLVVLSVLCCLLFLRETGGCIHPRGYDTVHGSNTNETLLVFRHLASSIFSNKVVAVTLISHTSDKLADAVRNLQTCKFKSE